MDTLRNGTMDVVDDMPYWHEQYVDIGLRDEPYRATDGMYIYNDEHDKWNISLSREQDGSTVLAITPLTPQGLIQLKAAFPQQDYAYEVYVNTGAIETLCFTINNEKELYSEQHLFSRLERILPYFTELNSALDRTGILPSSLGDDAENRSGTCNIM